jgi:hypothetical protein
MYKEKYLNRHNKPKRKNILFFEWDDTLCGCYKEWLTDYSHTCVSTKKYEEGLVVFKDSIKKSDDKNKTDDKFFDLVVLTDDLPSDNRAGVIDAVDIAIEILNIKKDQRLLFALVYPPKVFVRHLLKLQSIPVMIHKPFTKEEFLHFVEDDYMYDIASDISKRISAIKNLDDDEKPLHRSCTYLYDLLKFARISRMWDHTSYDI